MHRDQDVSLLQVTNRAIEMGQPLHPRIRWDTRTKQAIAVTPAISIRELDHYLLRRGEGPPLAARQPELMFQIAKKDLLSPWMLWHT